MQLNQQQLQAICTQQLVQLVDQNYVPGVVSNNITRDPQIQQIVPMLAVLTIMRTQNNAQQRPSHFSLATLNLLGNNGYNNAEFQAVIRVLADGFPAFWAQYGNRFQNNVQGAVMTYAENFVKGAVALMYTGPQHQQVARVFDQQTQQAILNEASAMSQLLQSRGNSGQGGGTLSSLLGGNQQQQQGNQLLNFGAVKTGAGGLFNNTSSVPSLTTGNEQMARRESFYSKQLNNLRTGDKTEQIALGTDAGVITTDVQPLSTRSEAVIDADPVPRVKPATTVIIGDPDDGMVISSTTALNLSGPVDKETAYLFKSTHADKAINSGKLMQENPAELVWDMEGGTMSAEDFQRTVAIDPTDRTVINAESPPVEMSGFPGISKKGDILLRGYSTDMGEMANMLKEAGYYTAAQLKALGARWYPSVPFPTLPACDTKTHELRFYPILANNGLFAYAYRRETPLENMDYEKHGVGFVPAKFNKVEQVETREEPTTKEAPKPFKINSTYYDTLDMDTSFSGAYNQGALRFLHVVSEKQENVRDVYVQPVMWYQTFGFETEEGVSKVKAVLAEIAQADTFNDVLELLDKLDTTEDIPVREHLSRLFGTQVSRTLCLRIGTAVEIDQLDYEGWDAIQEYVNNEFPDPFIQIFYAAQKEMIQEVMAANQVIVDDGFTSGFIEMAFGSLPENAPNLLVFGNVEQVMYVPFIAAELEFTDHTENFLITEAAVKLGAMAKDLIERKAITVTHSSGDSTVDEDTVAVIPSASVIVTKDYYRVEVASSLIQPTSIVGRVRKI